MQMCSMCPIAIVRYDSLQEHCLGRVKPVQICGRGGGRGKTPSPWDSVSDVEFGPGGHRRRFFREFPGSSLVRVGVDKRSRCRKKWPMAKELRERAVASCRVLRGGAAASERGYRGVDVGMVGFGLGCCPWMFGKTDDLKP